MIIQQQQKEDLSGESEYDEHSDSFATSQFSTLTTVFGHLKGVSSHKNTKISKGMCVLRLVSSDHHLQLKCKGGHFFSVPSLHREY